MDDSFKKPGAVPFKWEIRPGVPKLRQPQDPLYEQPALKTNHNMSPFTCKIRPPPAAGFFYLHKTETQTKSFRARPECVSPGGCFPSPSLKRKNEKKNIYDSDTETIVSRRSTSSAKSLSSFRDSPISSSFSSFQSSPRVMVDADWAGFGLF